MSRSRRRRLQRRRERDLERRNRHRDECPLRDELNGTQADPLVLVTVIMMVVGCIASFFCLIGGAIYVWSRSDGDGDGTGASQDDELEREYAPRPEQIGDWLGDRRDLPPEFMASLRSLRDFWRHG